MKVALFITLLVANGALPAVCPAQQESDTKTESDSAEKGMLPVHPRELIPALPQKPKKWNLILSTGETTYAEWLESRVIREFEEIDEGDSGKTQRTRIVIVDTAKRLDALAFFADFDANDPESFEKEEDDYVRKIIDSWPAVVIDFGEDGIDIEMLVHERYLLQFTLENQAEENVLQWLKRCDLAALKAIPDTPELPLPEKINIVKFDQINPGNSLAYRLATTSGKRLDQELAEDVEWVRQQLVDIPKITNEAAPD